MAKKEWSVKRKAATGEGKARPKVSEGAIYEDPAGQVGSSAVMAWGSGINLLSVLDTWI
jgi:hypothetical protein